MATQVSPAAGVAGAAAPAGVVVVNSDIENLAKDIATALREARYGGKNNPFVSGNAKWFLNTPDADAKLVMDRFTQRIGNVNKGQLITALEKEFLSPTPVPKLEPAAPAPAAASASASETPAPVGGSPAAAPPKPEPAAQEPAAPQAAPAPPAPAAAGGGDEEGITGLAKEIKDKFGILKDKATLIVILKAIAGHHELNSVKHQEAVAQLKETCPQLNGVDEARITDLANKLEKLVVKNSDGTEKKTEVDKATENEVAELTLEKLSEEVSPDDKPSLEDHAERLFDEHDEALVEHKDDDTKLNPAIDKIIKEDGETKDLNRNDKAELKKLIAENVKASADGKESEAKTKLGDIENLLNENLAIKPGQREIRIETDVKGLTINTRTSAPGISITVEQGKRKDENDVIVIKVVDRSRIKDDKPATVVLGLEGEKSEPIELNFTKEDFSLKATYDDDNKASFELPKDDKGKPLEIIQDDKWKKFKEATGAEIKDGNINLQVEEPPEKAETWELNAKLKSGEKTTIKVEVGPSEEDEDKKKGEGKSVFKQGWFYGAVIALLGGLGTILFTAGSEDNKPMAIGGGIVAAIGGFLFKFVDFSGKGEKKKKGGNDDSEE